MLVFLQMFIYNPVYKTGNGHLRSGNCQKTLDVGITLPVDIYLYPVAYRITYQIGGFIRTGFRRFESGCVFQYLKCYFGSIIIPIVMSCDVCRFYRNVADILSVFPALEQPTENKQ